MSWVADYVSRWVLRRPELVLGITGLARRVKPILSLGRTTVLLRNDDVRDVLNRVDSFEIGPLARQKMLAGDFLLGMDGWPKYLQDKPVLREVLDVTEESMLDVIASKCCKDALEQLSKKINCPSKSPSFTRIDLIKDFAEPVVTRFVLRFFLGLNGESDLADYKFDSAIVRANEGRDLMPVDEQIFAQWLRKIGSVIVEPYPAQFGLMRIAEKANRELEEKFLTPLCNDRVEEFRSSGDHSERDANVLDGLVQSFEKINRNGASKECVTNRVRRNITGLMLAGSAPLLNSIAAVIDQLLRRRDLPMSEMTVQSPSSGYRGFGVDTTADLEAEIAEAETLGLLDHAINLAGRFADADDPSSRGGRPIDAPGKPDPAMKLITQLVLEAMRFRTTFPFLARYCPLDDVTGEESPEMTAVRSGSTVVVSQLSAMHDAEHVPNPEEFAYRPDDSYMHFGFGGHACLGRSIATRLLTYMTAYFLQVKGIEEASPGRYSYDGPAVDGFILQLPYRRHDQKKTR